VTRPVDSYLQAGLYCGRLPTPADIACVTVDETMLGDHTLPGSVILLANQTVEVEVTLKPPPAPSAQSNAASFNDDPFSGGDPFGGTSGAGASARAPPTGGFVDFDGQSEVFTHNHHAFLSQVPESVTTRSAPSARRRISPLGSPWCRSISTLRVRLKKISYAQFFLTKLKKAGRAINKLRIDPRSVLGISLRPLIEG